MKENRLIQGFVALLFFAMFIYGMSCQMIGTLITRIILHYDIRMAQAGLMSSFINIGNFAAIFLISVLSGRINKLILLGASLFFFSASLFLISTAPSFGILLACFALVGVFGATLNMIITSLVADMQPDKISQRVSLVHGFFGLGGLCGPIVFERLVVNLNWAQAHFIVSMIFVVYLIIYAVFVRWQWSPLMIRMPHEKQSRFGFSDIVQFFLLKRHLLMWIIVFFYGGGQSTLAIWIKRYVETHLNEPAWGAYALSAMWLGIAVSRLIISPGIKAPSLRKIFVGNLISAAALTAGLFSGSVQGIAAASLAVGLSSGLTVPLILSLGCEWHPDKTTFGTLMPFTAFYVSYVVFPPFSGLISDLLGLPWGVALGILCAILTSVFSGMLDLHMKTERVK